MQCVFCDRWFNAANHLSAHYDRCLLRRLAVGYHLLDDDELLSPFTWMHQYYDQDDDYERNLQTIEAMGGAVLVGVPDVDAVTTRCGTVDSGCPVCMEGDIPRGRRTLCGHVFCAPCIERWLRDHKRCPVCNTDLVDAAAAAAAVT
jgi:hypothetical protein